MDVSIFFQNGRIAPTPDPLPPRRVPLHAQLPSEVNLLTLTLAVALAPALTVTLALALARARTLIN